MTERKTARMVSDEVEEYCAQTECMPHFEFRYSISGMGITVHFAKDYDKGITRRVLLIIVLVYIQSNCTKRTPVVDISHWHCWVI